MGTSSHKLLCSVSMFLALYKQFWHAQYPNLCFIGIPHSIVPFPFFEIQAESATAQFQKFSLPDVASRVDEASIDATSGGAKVDGRIQDTHFLGSAQWDYCRMMAKIGGIYNDEMEGYIATNKVCLWKSLWKVTYIIVSLNNIVTLRPSMTMLEKLERNCSQEVRTRIEKSSTLAKVTNGLFNKNKCRQCK